MDLSSQYQGLANESKRKHVDVREAAEKAIGVLRAHDDSRIAFEHLQQGALSLHGCLCTGLIAGLK